MSRLHPFRPFRPNEDVCDECGDPPDGTDHVPGLREYAVEFRAVVMGTHHVYARSRNEARREVLTSEERELYGAIDNYHSVLQTAEGRLLRITQIKLVEEGST